MPETFTLAVIAAVFLVGGFAKGLTGFGLPTVAVGLLTAFLGLADAIVLMLVPAFATNVWQALAGGHGRALLGRIWPFLAAAVATIWMGSLALTRVEVSLLTALLGALLAAYGLVGLTGIRFPVAPARERTAGIVAGGINGVLTGMTGTFTVVGIMYLQGLGLARDALVQAMGMLFLVSSVALGLSLGTAGLISNDTAMGSLLALIPAFAGMAAGQGVRHLLSEDQFRRVFLIALALLGAYLFVVSMTG